MPINVKFARMHAARLAYITRNIAFYRALASLGEKYTQSFWIYARNNFLDMAVLEWCKVLVRARRRPTGAESYWTTTVSETLCL